MTHPMSVILSPHYHIDVHTYISKPKSFLYALPFPTAVYNSLVFGFFACASHQFLQHIGIAQFILGGMHRTRHGDEMSNNNKF